MIIIIILNEKKYAEECLKNGTIDKKPFVTLSILAKYYYHCFGYKSKKITSMLMDFMSTNYPPYKCNQSAWNESIEKIARNVKKYPLHEIDGVWITELELLAIEEINNKVLERLAFTLLCLAKLGNLRNPKNNNWVNYDAKEIFKLARVSGTVLERYKKLGELRLKNYLEFAKKIDNLSCRVIHIDDSSNKKLFVSDFRELGYEYAKYNGENFIRCKECGILVRSNKSNTKKYCLNCSSYQPIKFRKIICMDCGKEVLVSSMNRRTCRCADCQDIANRNRKRIWKYNKENE